METLATDIKGRPFPAPVAVLDLPAGARRVWRGPDGMAVRALDGLGPKGYRPVGYVAENLVIVEPFATMTDVEIHHIATHYASEPGAIPQPRLTKDVVPALTGARCRLCGSAGDLPHALDCAHAGKIVGDVVRR